MSDPTTTPLTPLQRTSNAPDEDPIARMKPLAAPLTLGIGGALPLNPDHTEDTSPTCIPTALDQFDFDTDADDEEINFNRAVAQIRNELKSSEGIQPPDDDSMSTSTATSLRQARASQTVDDDEPSTVSVFIATALVTSMVVGGCWLLFTLL